MLIAVILAGGTGTRMGADRPKQFLPLGGRMVVERAIDAFDRAPCVDEVAVVVHPEWLEFMAEIVARNRWAKLTRIIRGGSERYQSSLNALKAYADAPEGTNVLLHDAARPWVSQEIIAKVGEALQDAQAVGVGIPSTDTLWQTDPLQGRVSSIPDRSTMYRAQTPQAFRLSAIAEAYRRALLDDAFQATDDCGVLLRYCPEIPIRVVLGEEQNRKITYLQDLV